jgi:hypothetical protein
MSVAAKIENLTAAQRRQIADNTLFEFKGKGPQASSLRLMMTVDDEVEGSHLIFPLVVARQMNLGPPLLPFDVEGGVRVPPKPHQTEVLARAARALARKGGIHLECSTGFGKTYCCVNLAMRAGVPFLVTTHNQAMVEGWVSEIRRFTGLEAGRMDNAEAARRHAGENWAGLLKAPCMVLPGSKLMDLPPAVAARFGVVVIDESGEQATKSRSMGFLWCFGAQAVIGCSATRERPDGAHVVLEAYYGRESIEAILLVPGKICFADVGVTTDYGPFIEACRASRQKGGVLTNKALVEYGRVEKTLAYSEDNNWALAGLIAAEAERDRGGMLLVLTKYIDQALDLANKLETMFETSPGDRDLVNDLGVDVYVGEASRGHFSHLKARQPILKAKAAADKEYKRALAEWRAGPPEGRPKAPAKGAVPPFNGFARVLIATQSMAQVGFDQAALLGEGGYRARYNVVYVLQGIGQPKIFLQALGRVCRTRDPLFFYMTARNPEFPRALGAQEGGIRELAAARELVEVRLSDLYPGGLGFIEPALVPLLDSVPADPQEGEGRAPPPRKGAK